MRIWLAVAAIDGLAGVAMGAVGAHAFAGTLDAVDLAVLRQAADYQVAHALALLGVAALAERRASRTLDLAGALFALGIAGFSGGIYMRVLGGVSLGPVVPIGGTMLMLGWLALLAAAFARRP
jgi:uncharacterized membrane protein YgdD (TMEM256/DUF423 family)